MQLNIQRYWDEYKIHWIKYPMLRIFLPFVTGILLTDRVTPHLGVLSGILILLCLVLIFLHIQIRSNFDYIPWFGVITILLFFLFGLFWANFRNELAQSDHFVPDSKSSLISRVFYVEEKDKYWDCYSDVLGQLRDTSWSKVNGKLLVRINKNASYIPKARDIIRGDYRILKPDHKSAPFEFDWSDLLHHRDIHYLTYLDTSKFSIIHKSDTSFLERSRKWSDEIVLNVFGNNRDYPVATAILLGLRRKIDPELYKAYSATGAVHVLAVSGLHVGILSSIIEFVFGFFFKKIKTPKWFLPLIVITVIWLYTLLTGATPSILRSAIMFTLFIIGRYKQKDSQPLNILAVAAFILLVWNPLDIYNIGFQLSFGAMAGIFILYEPIRVLFAIENKYLQWIWKVMAVSMAAQLVIYPIVGFHFHQFAFYFWLTSLVSTPFSYIILAVGIVIFPIKALGLSFLNWIDYILIYSVKWMNDIIAWLYTMPFGKLRGWWPTKTECFILITISFLIAHLLNRRNIYTLRPPTILLIGFFGIAAIGNIQDGYISEIVISKFRGKDKIWVKSKRALIQLTGDSTILNSNYVDKYDIPKESIFVVDSNRNTYNNEKLSIQKSTIQDGASNYKFIVNQQDKINNETFVNPELFVLNKYWMPDTNIKNVLKMYVFDTQQYHTIKSLYPEISISLIENSFIQIPLR